MGDAALRLGHCMIDDLVETSGSAAARHAHAASSHWPARSAERVTVGIGHAGATSSSRHSRRTAARDPRPVGAIRRPRRSVDCRHQNRLHEFDGGKHREPEVQSRDLTRDGLLIEAEFPAVRLYQGSAAQRWSLHHRFERQAAGSQLGSFPAPPVERHHRRFDVRPPGSRPSSPQLAHRLITVGRLQLRPHFRCICRQFPDERS
jgi:hypothetical protein